MNPPVSFSDIETQKENIIPRKEGRSAASLAATFAVPPLEARASQKARREKFELDLSTALELDDPIVPYLDYLQWITNEYPQGDSQDSGYLDLLIRCTETFRDKPYYKDDFRYVRVWMEFARYSDTPIELFSYLARKGIGQGLALFYEEFATYLESSGRMSQADEVYQVGLQAEARPVERLRRRYNEFKERLKAIPPSETGSTSPIMPASRPALALKEGDLPDMVAGQPENGPSRPKIAVFTDSEGEPSAATGKWDTTMNTAIRRKENTVESTSWVGQKLPSHVEKPKRTISVFQDPPQQPHPPPAEEEMKIPLQVYYDPATNEEYCFEELVARAMGVYGKKYPRKAAKIRIGPRDSLVPLKGKSPAVAPRNNLTIGSPVKIPNSPTMTMHTRAATDDVVGMFNQPIKGDSSDDDGDEDDGDDEMDGYYESDETGLQSLQSGPQGQGMQQLISNTREMTVNEPQHDSTGILNISDPSVREQYGDTITSAISHDPRYHRFSGLFDDGCKFSKETPGKKRPGAFGEKMITFPDSSAMFALHRVLGTGSYGAVHLAESEKGELVALKSEPSPLPWEYYILVEAESRLRNERCLDSIVRTSGLFQFDDEYCMALSYCNRGTLLDLVNAYRQKHDGNGFDEIVVAYYTVELLRVVEGLHSQQIIHGDLKADNVMVRFANTATPWSRQYQTDGGHGWSQRGVTLIDFGLGIDAKMFPASTQFVSNWVTDSLDCMEMRHGKPWTYQVDYHGLATIVHLLLFGKPLQTSEETDSAGQMILKVTTPLKRYWRKDIWDNLFFYLLNSKAAGEKLPMLQKLRRMRVTLEQWLCDKGDSLKASLETLDELSKRR